MIRSFALSFVLLATGCSVASTATTESGAQDLAAAPESVIQTVSTSKGDVIADLTGLSLYTFDPDTTSESTCYNGCATAWPPALVDDAVTELAAPLSLTTRHDGKKQIVFNGDPLYRYVGDAAQGDVKGDGLGHVWHLARPVQQ